VPGSQEAAAAAEPQQQQQQGGEEDVTEEEEEEEEEEEGLINSDSPGKEQRALHEQHSHPQQGLQHGSLSGVKRQRLGYDSPAEPNSQPHALADILNQQHQQLGGSAGPGKAAPGGGSYGHAAFIFEGHTGGSDRDDAGFD
jgi:hypothetical protein